MFRQMIRGRWGDDAAEHGPDHGPQPYTSRAASPAIPADKAWTAPGHDAARDHVRCDRYGPHVVAGDVPEGAMLQAGRR